MEPDAITTQAAIDATQAAFDLRLILIPIVCALIGYLTNVLAVRMIFRPRRPIGPSWMRIQGLVPKRQADMAAAIGHTVQKHLVSHADVQAILAKPDVQNEVDQLVRDRIDTIIEQRLKPMNPMIGMFLTGPTRDKLESMLLEEVRALTPKLSERMIDRIENELDFQKIVEERVRGFELDRLESIILEIASRELKAIEIFGGVLGFIIGLVQVAILIV